MKRSGLRLCLYSNKSDQNPNFLRQIANSFVNQNRLISMRESTDDQSRARVCERERESTQKMRLFLSFCLLLLLFLTSGMCAA